MGQSESTFTVTQGCLTLWYRRIWSKNIPWLRIQKGTWNWCHTPWSAVGQKVNRAWFQRWEMCGLEFWWAELIVGLGWTLRCRGQFKPPGWTAAAVGSHTLARYTVCHSGSTTGSPSGSPLLIHQRGWLLYWCSIQIYPDGNRGNLSCLMCPIMALETPPFSSPWPGLPQNKSLCRWWGLGRTPSSLGSVSAQ